MFRLIPDIFYREPGEPKRIPRDQCAFVGIHLDADTCTAAALAGDGAENLYFDAARTQTVLSVTLENGTYRRFFRLPGDDARECYLGDWTQPSCEALMKRFFRDTVASLLEHNPETFAGKRRVLLSVSHPTSPRWHRAGRNYRDTLQMALNIPGWEGKLFVLPMCESMAAMAREYHRGGISTRENLLVLTFDGDRFRATPVFRGCRNFATGKPGQYHPYSGTLQSQSSLGSPLSLQHRCGSFLTRVKAHFPLDASLPEDRVSRIILWGRAEFLPDMAAAVAAAFPEAAIGAAEEGGHNLALGLSFAGKIEYLKGLLMDFARNSFQNCLQNTADKLRLCLTEAAADKALACILGRTTSWCYYNFHEDSRSFHEAVLADLSFDFPFDTVCLKLNALLKSWKNAAKVGVLEDFSQATGTILSNFSLDDPTDTRPAGSRPRYVPENWSFTLTEKTLEALAGEITPLTQAMIDRDQLFGLKGLTLDAHMDTRELSAHLRSKMYGALSARQENLRLYLRRHFDLKAVPICSRLKDRLYEELMNSLENWLIRFTPYILQYQETPNPEGVLQNVTNG